MNKEAIGFYECVAPSIKDFCKPLNDYLGISHFAYFKIYHKDFSYITFSNDFEITKQYCSSVTSDKIYFHNFIENNNVSELILWPNKPTNPAMQLIFNRGYWHGFDIIKVYDDYIEGCCFVADKNNQQIKELFIKNYVILEKFAEYFKIVFSKIISKGEIYKARYKDGFNFYIPRHELIEPPDIQAFLEATGMHNKLFQINGKSIYLTPRERECLELLDKGYTLKGIAQQLHVAHKTVEAHITNIKQKSNLNYRHQLITMYRESLL